MSWWRRYVTQADLQAVVNRIERQLMATQADIDQLTTEVQQVAADLQTAQQTLQAEIDKLSQANPSVDVSALQAAVAPLDSAVQALGNLQPTPPAA